MSLHLHIDLDADGDYTDPNEDLTAYLLSAAWSLGREHPADGMPADGKATFILNNAGRRFSPDNANSPLFDQLVTGRSVRLQLDTSGGLVTLWQGWLETIAVNTGQTGERRAVLECHQGLHRLREVPVGLPVQVNQTAGTIIDAALSQVVASPTLTKCWQVAINGHAELGNTTFLYNPQDQLNSDTGLTTFPYAGDTWRDDTSLLDALVPLIEAENGVFWQDREGRFHFQDRHYWLLNRTVTDTLIVDEDTVGAMYDYGHDVTNNVQVIAYPRQVSAQNQVIWQSTQKIRVAANRTLAMTTQLTSPNGDSIGLLDVESPQPFADYTAVNTEGNDVTAAITVEVGVEGSSLALKFYNGTTLDVFVSIQVRGQTISLQEPVAVKAQDALSVNQYGPHRRTYNLVALSEVDAAVDFARWLLLQNVHPRGALCHITFKAREETWLKRMATLTFGQRITLQDNQSAHSGDYFVVGETFEWSPADGLVGKFALRPADLHSAWLLGTSELGSETIVVY